MSQMQRLNRRRTNVDTVFECLYDKITSMQLLPGAKISEAEIAMQLGVSRQPVRDAFSRLENLGLLLIQPQRATEVRRFSRREIIKSRFIRGAVEERLVRQAAQRCNPDGAATLDQCLSEQIKVAEARDYATFTVLDFAFHKCICEIAAAPFAFDVIYTEKAKLDRLCILGLSREDRLSVLLKDHQAIAEAIKQGDAETGVSAMALHLSRVDETIATISASTPEFFEP